MSTLKKVGLGIILFLLIVAAGGFAYIQYLGNPGHPGLR